MARGPVMLDPRHILVARIDKVGDLILTTPALRQLRESWPHARISVLVSPQNAMVLDGWDGVDDLITYDAAAGLGRSLQLLAGLRARHFDLALVFSPIFRAYVAAAWSGAPVRAGVVYSRRVFARAFAPFLLTHGTVFRIDEAVGAGHRVPHEVEQTFQVLKALGLCVSDRPLELPVREADRGWAGRLTGRVFGRRSYLALHLSAHWLARGGTPADFASLLGALLDIDPDLALLVTHGPADRSAFEIAARAIPFQREELDGAVVQTAHARRLAFAGGLSFGRWAALLGSAELVVTRDTGALHVAAATARAVVAVYESATFAHCSQQWAPWRVSHRSLESRPWPALIPAIVTAATDLLPRTTGARS